MRIPCEKPLGITQKPKCPATFVTRVIRRPTTGLINAAILISPTVRLAIEASLRPFAGQMQTVYETGRF
jgi:hypothetical protein